VKDLATFLLCPETENRLACKMNNGFDPTQVNLCTENPGRFAAWSRSSGPSRKRSDTMAAGKSVSNDLLPEKARGAGDSNVHRFSNSPAGR
jgi:hypothetical protein